MVHLLFNKLSVWFVIFQTLVGGPLRKQYCNIKLRFTLQ